MDGSSVLGSPAVAVDREMEGRLKLAVELLETAIRDCWAESGSLGFAEAEKN